MQKSQAEKGHEDSRSDNRSRLERARDEMTPEAYDALIQRALDLIHAS